MAESLDLNFKQPSKTTNSATEFDTELFQTNTRELSQELSGHADDSNPVQDNFHNFLPEHASRKTRDKRKRKTPQSTAVNRQKTVRVSRPAQEPQTPASTMEDHKTSILCRPH
ncbi:hypothetical protein ACTXT7_009218 [Hymenolepis weldensis]